MANSKEKLKKMSAVSGKPNAEDPTIFRCCCCGKEFTKQASNFPASESSIYDGNFGCLPACKACVENLYMHYVDVFASEEKAIRHLCIMFDIYFSKEIFERAKSTENDLLLITNYLRKTHLLEYKKKTYDDTIEEERKILEEPDEEFSDNTTSNISKETIRFFGLGFKPEEYVFLQDQYDDWVARHECKTKSQEEVFKNLCIAQLNIQTAQQKGGKVTEAMRAFQDLLGTANLKPSQTNDSVLTDQNSFGTLIKKWENDKPIPEPDPEWRDVDGIRKYVNVFFLGHLAKMMGIENKYSRLADEYEAEMEKYRVQKPEYEPDSSDDESYESYDDFTYEDDDISLDGGD